MTADSLNNVRPLPRYVGWVVDDHGGPAIRVQVDDVCRSGAKISCFAGQKFSDEFTLHFDRTGAAKIRCKVKWRSDRSAGVAFVAMPGLLSGRSAAAATPQFEFSLGLPGWSSLSRTTPEAPQPIACNGAAAPGGGHG